MYRSILTIVLATGSLGVLMAPAEAATEAHACIAEAGDGPLRSVWVDPAALGVQAPGMWVTYDLTEVLGPISLDGLRSVSDLSLAVRLVLSEVGPDRLVHNQVGLDEAVGILQTVDNRLDPATYNPDAVRGLRPYPGCGLRGSFSSCANPNQYLGLGTRRALRPTQSASLDQLGPAADLAVTAFWLLRAGVAPDVAQGGTSFVHRCGGAAYGKTTGYCDGRPDPSDMRGGDPVSGPVVFRRPSRLIPSRGYYAMRESAVVHYDDGAAFVPRPPPADLTDACAAVADVWDTATP